MDRARTGQQQLATKSTHGISMQIRQITSYDELSGIEALQTAIWQFEPMAVTPRHVFIAAIRSGGLVLGAFDSQDTFIGFALAFRGERHDRPCLYSHLVGVLPSMQSQGVGYDLKMQQREFAKSLGYESIVWTFDPLLAKNACLNIQKLGGKVYTFLPNTYGSTAFKLFGSGFPTHRLELCWHVNEPIEPEDQPVCQATPVIEPNPSNYPTVNHDLLYHPDNKTLALPIPAHHLPMRIDEPEKAHRWQESVCLCAKTLLNSGYSIQRFESGDQHSSYIFKHKSLTSEL